VSAARILLADDSSEMRQKVAELLLPDFQLVGSVADGQQAVESALKLHPDVIVLDISMPVLNGIQVASTLRELRSTAKLIFLSVHADYDYVEAAFSLGVHGYVLKSRITTDLIPALEQVLRGGTFTSEFPTRKSHTPRPC